MKLYLDRFDSFPCHTSLKAEPDEISIEYESLVQIDKAELELDIQMAGEEFFCQGTAKASVRVTCARCLEEFNDELASTTDFIICSKESHESHRSVEDNEEYVYFEGPDLQVDVSGIMREAVIVELAIKPLCSEDCRGLCPKCGVNRNERTCTCRDNHTDERWDALRKLSGLT